MLILGTCPPPPLHLAMPLEETALSVEVPSPLCKDGPPAWLREGKREETTLLIEPGPRLWGQNHTHRMKD